MDKYNVTGMSCAACSTRVEKAVSKLEGITKCEVNLLTNSMNVEGSATEEEIIKAVTDAGYGASKVQTSGSSKALSGTHSRTPEDEFKDTETPKLMRRLIFSVAILIPLMYESMGHMLWNWPLPKFLDNNHVGMGIYELLLTTAIIIINQKFFVSGFKGLINKAPNMDTLVALGASSAFVYSLYSLMSMSYYQSIGDMSRVMELMNGFYFESSATILTLITVGKTLEARSKGKTTDALKGLMKLKAKSAIAIIDNKEVEVSIESLKPNDLFVVKPGASIPVDGRIIEGNTSVDESTLTGESIPVDKKAYDEVFEATINKEGHIICEVLRVGEDSSLSRIIKMVTDASSTKAPIAKIADKVSGVFVPTVIALSLMTLIVWLIIGRSFGFSLERAISVLVISCPCALGLATPVAIMVGSGVGAKNGILFKNAVSLEETGRVNIVALDKTGTITKGEPEVKSILTEQQITQDELLSIAYSIESKSEHPLGKAIVKKAEESGAVLREVRNFTNKVGNGLEAVIDAKNIKAGNVDFISQSTNLTQEQIDKINILSDSGKTPVLISQNNELIGIIAIADSIKEDSRAAISRLKSLGLKVVMITGDNERTANAIAQESGVDNVIAGVLPDGKAKAIQKLQQEGKVIMVGDGINDAPALTSADIGIAIGAGTDIAIESADVVLMRNSLTDVCEAVRISRKTLRNIHQNLFWAFIYNVIGIPLAMGVWYPLFGLTLNPMFGAAAMGLSSFCVVSNSLRLNLFRRQASINPVVNINPKEDTKMEIKVKGMMCGHCEAHVKKALEAVDGITCAIPSHETGIVKLTCDKEIPEEVLKSVIEEAGYEYIG